MEISFFTLNFVISRVKTVAWNGKFWIWVFLKVAQHTGKYKNAIISILQNLDLSLFYFEVANSFRLEMKLTANRYHFVVEFWYPHLPLSSTPTLLSTKKMSRTNTLSDYWILQHLNMHHILILRERARSMISTNLMQRTQVNITFRDLYVYLLLMQVPLKDLHNS